MDNYIYVINPNYRLLNDIYRAIILTLNDNAVVNCIDHSKNFEAVIHPLHAQILSFFTGEDNYHTILSNIEEYLELPREEIESFVDKFIENEHEFTISTGKTIVRFPKNILIKKSLCDHYNVYDLLDFPLGEKVDMVSNRFYIPRSFFIILNTYCYTDCIYCYADKNTKVGGYLTTSRIKGIIDEMISLKAYSIDLNGGEILLHPNHMEITGYVISKGFSPYISTKCPLSEEKIKELKSVGLSKIQISIDSSNTHTLSTLLNVRFNYYSDMLRTISYLEKYGFEIIIHCKMIAIRFFVYKFVPIKHGK